MQKCPVSVQQHEITDAENVVDSTGRIRDQQVSDSQLFQHTNRERRAFQRMPFVEMNSALQQQSAIQFASAKNQSAGMSTHGRTGQMRNPIVGDHDAALILRPFSGSSQSGPQDYGCLKPCRNTTARRLFADELSGLLFFCCADEWALVDRRELWKNVVATESRSLQRITLIHGCENVFRPITCASHEPERATCFRKLVYSVSR
jgi:hypothetical protein